MRSPDAIRPRASSIPARRVSSGPKGCWHSLLTRALNPAARSRAKLLSTPHSPEWTTNSVPPGARTSGAASSTRSGRVRPSRPPSKAAAVPARLGRPGLLGASAGHHSDPERLRWAPTVDARTALGDFIAAAREGANTVRPPLRPRTARDLLRRLLRFGPVGDRHLT